MICHADLSRPFILMTAFQDSWRVHSSANWSLLKLQDGWAYLFCLGTLVAASRKDVREPIAHAELQCQFSAGHTCVTVVPFGSSQFCIVSQVVLCRHYKSWQDLEVWAQSACNLQVVMLCARPSIRPMKDCSHRSHLALQLHLSTMLHPFHFSPVMSSATSHD